MQYSERGIKFVSIGDMSSTVRRDGANSVAGTVRFILEPLEAHDVVGPTVSVDVSVDMDASEPIGNVETALLAAARDLLNRFAHESLEALQEIHVRTRDLRT